jgi:hypothetical protein
MDKTNNAVRCDFSSVVRVLFSYMSKERKLSQPIFFEELFAPLLIPEDINDKKLIPHMPPDNSAISRWITGREDLPATYVDLYLLHEENQESLLNILNDKILPLLFDKHMAAQRISEFIQYDTDISKQVKKQLLELCPCETDEEIAEFIRDVLLFCFERPFKRYPLVTSSGISSPAVSKYIRGCNPPKPCKHFRGRIDELAALHEKTREKGGKVFVNGIPGIGKSELVKAYAAEHDKNKSYSNILYFSYPGSLRDMVTDIDFADDGVNDSREELFERHNSFLRGLQEDTLIIVDNFDRISSEEEITGEIDYDISPLEDEFLSEIMNYSCRIIFTTRSLFENYDTFELAEMGSDDLLSLFSEIYPDTEKNAETIKAIIDEVHRHTLAVDMSANILNKGITEPAQLLAKLQEGYDSIDSGDRFKIFKDGKNSKKKKTYYGHIRALFVIFLLSEQRQNIMRNMVLVPLDGIKTTLFKKLLGLTSVEDIDDLTALGFIHNISGTISLRPMVKDATRAELHPSTENCAVFLENIRVCCLHHGKDKIQYYPTVFQIVESIVKHIDKNDESEHLSLIGDAFSYMLVKEYAQGMELVLNDMSSILKNPNSGDDKNRALFYHNKAIYEEFVNGDKEKALLLEDKALELCTDDYLKFTINANKAKLYYYIGDLSRAKPLFESAMSFINSALEQNAERHDFIAIIRNYAIYLLYEKGPNEAISLLQNWASKIKDSCIDDYVEIVFDVGMIHSATNINSPLMWDCFREAFRACVENKNLGLLNEKKQFLVDIAARKNITVPQNITEMLMTEWI